MATAMEFGEKELSEAKRLKSYFPYRIVYLARAEDGKFECGAVTSMRVPNKLARAGYVVSVLR